MDHEIGHAPPRGLPEVQPDEDGHLVVEVAGKSISLPPGLTMTAGPQYCPACASADVGSAEWDDENRVWLNLTRDEVHPLVWGEGYGASDTYMCRSCDAGWMEGHKPHPITWVRPWRTSS